MASHCIGLDLGSTAIKLVQLRTGRHGLSLENFGVAAVPAGAVVGGMVQQPALVVAALRELTTRIGLRGTDVALAVSGNGVIIKRISVPQLEPDAFARQLEWEARQLVAPPSRDDVLIDHTRLRQNPMTGEVETFEGPPLPFDPTPQMAHMTTVQVRIDRTTPDRPYELDLSFLRRPAGT